MLKQDELLFLLVWILNFVFSVLYLFWKKQDRENRISRMIRSVVMILCPVAGPLFFLCSYWIRKLFFHQDADLADVIFSKERVKTHLKADEERERNMVPLEEALAISDKKNLRTLMLNVIRGDLKESLEAIHLALNSEDSETSHYAASVLRDELNNFRVQVRKLMLEIQEEGPEETSCEELLLDYMNGVLKQHVFTDLEQKNFVGILEETGETLYRKNRARMSPARYEDLCLQLLHQNQFENTSLWYLRLKEQYPRELASYTCGLKLYFKMQDQKKFFEVMEELKNSDIVIDSETLEAFHTFRQS